ncbi:phage head-tail connector protein [Enterococcus sp. LJL90]
MKTRLEDSEVSVNDTLLADLLDDAESEVLAVTNQAKLNSSLERVVVSSVVIKVNRLGTEGLSSEGYSGVSTSYLDGLPAGLQAVVHANSRIGSWGDENESE